MGSMLKPPSPPKPTPAPPPVSATGLEKQQADEDARRRAAARYNFSDTVLSPAGRRTLG